MAYNRLQRLERAFKLANHKRHHAEARADSLALQRNAWRNGFREMQEKRNAAEKERDLLVEECDKLHERIMELRQGLTNMALVDVKSPYNMQCCYFCKHELPEHYDKCPIFVARKLV